MSFFQKVILQSLIVVTIMFASLSHAGETNKQLLAKGVWRDPQTGLVWMRCRLGKTWTGEECSGEAESLNWWDAIRKAKQAKFGGYNDWRLPSAPELASLLNRNGLVKGVLGYKKYKKYYNGDGGFSDPFTDLTDRVQLKDIERNFGTVLRDSFEEGENYFIKTEFLDNEWGLFWSATPKSVRVENKTLIWSYRFTPSEDGVDVLSDQVTSKSDSGYVFLVRSGRSLGDFEKSLGLVDKGDPEEKKQ